MISFTFPWDLLCFTLGRASFGGMVPLNHSQLHGQTSNCDAVFFSPRENHISFTDLLAVLEKLISKYPKSDRKKIINANDGFISPPNRGR